jgi:hypothetical protein
VLEPAFVACARGQLESEQQQNANSRYHLAWIPRHRPDVQRNFCFKPRAIRAGGRADVVEVYGRDIDILSRCRSQCCASKRQQQDERGHQTIGHEQHEVKTLSDPRAGSRLKTLREAETDSKLKIQDRGAKPLRLLVRVPRRRDPTTGSLALAAVSAATVRSHEVPQSNWPWARNWFRLLVPICRLVACGLCPDSCRLSPVSSLLSVSRFVARLLSPVARLLFSRLRFPVSGLRSPVSSCLSPIKLPSLFFSRTPRENSC